MVFVRIPAERGRATRVEIRIESEKYSVTEAGIVRRGNPVVSYHVDPALRDEGHGP